jgi:hypothetical protein
MRNIAIHIKLNVMRDNFIYDAKLCALNDSKIEDYRKQLDDIQKNNVKYWEKAINKI